MPNAVIVDAVRTPVAKGKPGGAYADIHPVDLHAHALAALVERTGIDPAVIDDVISGAVGQVGEQSGNTARWALLAAGFPESVPGVTIDRQCGSSQQTISFAAQGVIAGAYDIVVAAGVEVMSTTPMGASVTPGSFPMGARVMERYAPRGGVVMQGTSAEIIADKWGLSREELDAYSAESQRRAEAARDEGRFDNEIIPVTTKVFDRDSGQVIESDELVTAYLGYFEVIDAVLQTRLRVGEPDGPSLDDRRELEGRWAAFSSEQSSMATAAGLPECAFDVTKTVFGQ